MAEVFDISKHIKVEVLGSRQGTLVTPYNYFTVNGKEYNPNDYDIAYVPDGPATPLTPIRPTSFSADLNENTKLILNEVGSNVGTLVWRLDPNASSYTIYSVSSINPGWSVLWGSTIDYRTVVGKYFDAGYWYGYYIQVNLSGGGSYDYDPVFYGYQTTNPGWVDTSTLETRYDSAGVTFDDTSYPNGGILSFGFSNSESGWPKNFDGIDIDYGDRYLINVYPNNVSYPDFSVMPEAVFEGNESFEISAQIPIYKVAIGGLNLDTEPGYKFVVNLEKANGQVYQVGEYIYGQDPGDDDQQSNQIIASGWWPIECSVSQCEIDTGYNIEKGLLKTGEAGSASITLKGSEGNPTSNTSLTLDSKILIKLEAAASPDGTEDYLFSGYIESWSTRYDPFGNAITDIQCVDGLSKALNVNIPLYQYASEESFSTRMYNLFNDYLGPATAGTSGAVAYDINTLWPLLQPYDGSVFPPEYRENVSSSEIINELTEGEYGVIAQNRGGVIFWFNRASGGLFYDPTLIAAPPSFGFSTSHDPDSLDHHCISDFSIRNSLDDITNKVVASLTYDELTTADYENATSIAKYGERAYEVSLNVYAPSGNQTQYLDAWLADVPYSEDQPEIESVTTNVVNRKGLVTRAYQYDITFDPVRVFIQTGPVDFNGVLFAKRIRHSIDPDNWTMTLELTAD